MADDFSRRALYFTVETESSRKTQTREAKAPLAQDNGEIREYFDVLNALRNHYDVLHSGKWDPCDVHGGAMLPALY